MNKKLYIPIHPKSNKDHISIMTDIITIPGLGFAHFGLHTSIVMTHCFELEEIRKFSDVESPEKYIQDLIEHGFIREVILEK